MTQRRITPADLVFGEPLRWDIFGPGAEGESNAAPATTPLLQKGQVLAPSPQLDDLLEQGLFADAAPASVLHQLNEANKRLERLLMALRTEPSADRELRDIARDVIAAVELDPDIALATIYLNQIAGLYAVRHCIETAVVVVLVARSLGTPPPQIVTVTAAALTMNAGMVRQTEVFQCKDCSLSPDERAMVRRHPIESADMLRGAGVTDEEWLDCVQMHHENDDGSGYPEGRTGESIPRCAKLISLADRYCATVSARNYRRSMLPDEALRKIIIESEVPVEATLAEHFERSIGAHPPGCLVRLENGEIGVVARCDRADGLTVHALKGADGKPVAAPAERNCATPGCAIAEVLHEDQAGIRFSMKQIWGELASI